MKGTLYCIGVGPGDPELLTIKAVKYMQTCPVLAVPQGHTGVTTAKGIVLQAIEKGLDVNWNDKTIITIDFPMTRDAAVLEKAHADGAAAIEAQLQQGRDVALITLGCPTVYASSSYVHRRVHDDGYATEVIPGVPSFCAAAAKMQQPLCEQDEPLTVIPGNCKDRKSLLSRPGSKIIMKPSGSFTTLKQELQETQQLERTTMIERCGLPGEQLYHSLDGVDTTTYFSVLLVKGKKSGKDE